MKHQVRIVNFSISIAETLDKTEEEIAALLDQGFQITVSSGYTLGQRGSKHGGAFVILVKRGPDHDESSEA